MQRKAFTKKCSNIKTQYFSDLVLRDYFEKINNSFSDLPEEMIICKFKDTLTPQQMKTDIVFKDAPDNEPLRETIVIL